MEAMILKSMVHYQEDFFEFLEIVTQNCFSKKGLDILEKMIPLKEKEALSIQTLLSSLDENFKQSDYFLNFLSTEPNPNYLNFTQNFIFESKIKKQRLLAEKRSQAEEMRRKKGRQNPSKEGEQEAGQNPPKATEQGEGQKQPKEGEQGKGQQ